jgi:hypothetical protein
VEAHFIRLRGSPLILSPRELERVAGWHREGIPLHVVHRGVDDYFSRRLQRPASRQRAVTLEYCEEFVRRAFEQSRDLAVGGDPEHPAAEEQGSGELRQGLSILLQRLGRAREKQQGHQAQGLVEALDRAVSAVRDLLDRSGSTAGLSVGKVEAELEQLDSEVTEVLLLAAGEEAVADIRKACDAEMRETAGTMDRSLYQSTLRRMTIRRLRQSYSIPEISLFVL